MTKRGIEVGTSVAISTLFLITMLSTTVSAVEPVGNDFTGNVYRDGANAPVGVEVRAEVDGTIYGRTGTSNPGTGTTVYLMGTEGDDPATPQKDGIVNGEVMVFWVENMVCDESYDDWQEGQIIMGIPIPTLTIMDLHYSSAGQPALLKINEIMPNPEYGNEWVELYNPTSSNVNLNSYSFWKNDGSIPGTKIMDLTGDIQANGWYVVDLGLTPVLNDAGHDEIKLVWTDPGGVKAGGNEVVIDRVEFGSAGTGPDDTTNSNVEMGNAPTPLINVTIELEPDGDETNHPDSDFTPSSRPTSTKGYTNTQIQPLITVESPPAGITQADFNFLITWTDDDPDDNATIKLYYDDDDMSGNEIFICTVPQGEDSTDDSYLWDTSTMTIGNYYIKAEIDDGINPLSYDYSEGRVAVVHPPHIIVTQPDGISDFADWNCIIQWEDHDSDDNATITLYYDTDNIVGGETLIGSGPVPQGEDPDGGLWDSCIWNTTLVAEGDYYIKSTIYDGITAVYNYSSGVVSIRHPPYITILDPDGIEDRSDTSYTIRWTDWDADGDAVISLYYDSDDSGYDGTLIESGLSEDDPLDEYVWDTSMLPEGSNWYIYANITHGSATNFSYSIAPVTITHPPSIQLIEPDGFSDVADRQYTIRWDDHDTDDNATITLYYDGDSTPGGENLIGVVPQSEDPDGEGDSFVWDTTHMFEGLYYIKAVINDSTSSSYVYSLGRLTVLHNKTPSITLISPSQDVYVSNLYLITWVDGDPDDNATITLYYDDDSMPGNEILIGAVPQGEDSPLDNYLWNVSTLPSGSYYIKAVIDDGINQVEYDYSSGRIMVNKKPSITLVSPSQDVYVSDFYLITWMDDDPDDNATITLFYDDDPIPGNEVFIAIVPQGEDSTQDSYLWFVSILPSGSYYIKAEIDDGVNQVEYDYSSGRIMVNKKPSITLISPSMDVYVSDFYLITWVDEDPDDNATITLYYDDDPIPGNEILIAIVPQGEDGLLDSYLWDVSTVADGSYYIKSEIHDGINQVEYYYSSGRIIVDKTPPLPPELSGLDDLTGNSSLILGGEAEPFIWVDIYQNNVLIETLMTDQDGKFTFSLILYEGRNWFYAMAKDDAGNVGEQSQIEKTFLDTTPPMALITYFSSLSIVQWRQLTLIGEGLDANPIMDYEWYSNIDGYLGSSSRLTASSLSKGSHTIYFKVKDKVGLWSEPAEGNVEVKENIAPVLDAGPDMEITLGDKAFFSPKILDSDGPIIKYEWDFDGDGIYDWNSTQNGNAFFEYKENGTYQPSIRVTDIDGNQSTDSLTVKVVREEIEEEAKSEEGFEFLELLLILIVILLLINVILQLLSFKKMQSLISETSQKIEREVSSKEEKSAEEPIEMEAQKDETPSEPGDTNLAQDEETPPQPEETDLAQEEEIPPPIEKTRENESSPLPEDTEDL